MILFNMFIRAMYTLVDNFAILNNNYLPSYMTSRKSFNLVENP